MESSVKLVFSSLFFLFIFLPVTLVLQHFAKNIQQKEKNEGDCKENKGDSNKIKETDNCMATATGDTAEEEDTQNKSCMRCNIF